MIYDPFGRPIDPDKTPVKMQTLDRRMTGFEDIDRYDTDASQGLDPETLTAIFADANRGDPERQARLAFEIEEKDWDTSQALSVRTAAVLACELRMTPGDDTPRARQIAEDALAMLQEIQPEQQNTEEVGTRGVVAHCMSALLPGYACAEILWGPGGKTVQAFLPVRTSAITFRTSERPLIATTLVPTGIAMTPAKFIFHRHQARSGDATRGGLIRPLGWMWLFTSLGVKSLVRFVEKFGLPFVAAKIDEASWKTERGKIAALIRNFGADGGAVFSKSVELQLLEASGSAGNELFFRMLEYLRDAKTRVIQGQTASSSDSGGLSGGDAQSQVRHDLLEADCRAVETTLRDSVLRWWTQFAYGADAPVPVPVLDCEAGEDLEKLGNVVASLFSAGHNADPAWIEEKFGVRLARPSGMAALSDDEKKKTSATRPMRERALRW
jgi:phage gp29-like protein